MKPRKKSRSFEKNQLISTGECLQNESQISVCSNNNSKRIKLLFGKTYHPIEVSDWESYLKTCKSSFQKRYDDFSKSTMNRNDLIIIKTLAEGEFSRVSLMANEGSHVLFAAKCINKRKIMNIHMAKQIVLQKQILKSIRFPFLLYLEGFFQDFNYIYFIMPFLIGDSMENLLRKRCQLSENFVKFYSAQVLLGLEYLHFLNIIYRDLKPENILFDHHGYIKLIDFAFAKLLTNNRTYTFCGTLDYLAPEVILQKGYGLSADWWSFGVLLYELCYGRSPYHDEDDENILENIFFGKLKMPDWFSTSLKKLLKKLLTTDTTKRLGCSFKGADDVKRHYWFKSIDFMALVNRNLKPPYVPDNEQLKMAVYLDSSTESDLNSVTEDTKDKFDDVFKNI
uniref:Uncharacterized protein n=1 Tax=Rhodnius prolixus TaxID=13249 RepID=T1I2M1_RHOPR